MTYWWPRLFPLILILLDVVAAFFWLAHGNWRMFVYWIAAAVLTTCVTF